MIVKRQTSDKLAVAEITFERRFPGMESHVRLLPHVETPVLNEVAVVDEGFVAGLASVGSLSSVSPHVHISVGRRAEGRRTFSTLV